MTAAAQQRRDLHNISVDSSLAAEGLCGLTHLPTGRVCRLPFLHRGPCDLRPRLLGPTHHRLMPERTLADPKEP